MPAVFAQVNSNRIRPGPDRKFCRFERSRLDRTACLAHGRDVIDIDS